MTPVFLSLAGFHAFFLGLSRDLGLVMAGAFIGSVLFWGRGIFRRHDGLRRPACGFLIGFAAWQMAVDNHAPFFSFATDTFGSRRRAGADSVSVWGHPPPHGDGYALRGKSVQVISDTVSEQLAHGYKLFEHNCAPCHGEDARGDEGPDLHGLRKSDARLAKIIKGGIKGEMPAFAKKFNDADVEALIAYLRTLKE